MKNSEKIVKGLRYCFSYDGRISCDGCPYKNDRKPEINCPLGAEAIELIKYLKDALKLMVFQYCTHRNNMGKDILHNMFMSAGEAAFEVLGLQNGDSAEKVEPYREKDM